MRSKYACTLNSLSDLLRRVFQRYQNLFNFFTCFLRFFTDLERWHMVVAKVSENIRFKFFLDLKYNILWVVSYTVIWKSVNSKYTLFVSLISAETKTEMGMFVFFLHKTEISSFLKIRNFFLLFRVAFYLFLKNSNRICVSFTSSLQDSKQRNIFLFLKPFIIVCYI